MTRASDTAKLLGAGATILDGTTISTADNDAQLTLQSTDADSSSGPQLTLKRDSSSPADNDSIGKIKFISENDASEVVTYAEIYPTTPDVSDGTEDGQLHIDTMVAGTSRSRVKLMPAETVLNENSIDLDFRVESNGDANMLFVDGGNDRVGIATSSPTQLLDVVGSSANIRVAESGGGDLRMNVSGSTGGIGTHSNHPLIFRTNSGEQARIHPSGHFFINTSAPDITSALVVSGNQNADVATFMYNGNSGTFFDINCETANGSIILKADARSGNYPPLTFKVGNAERMRVHSDGNISIGKSSADNSTAGTAFFGVDGMSVARSGGTTLVLNRLTNDGVLVSFRQANGDEGNISVSGSTISYNGFSGLHESSGIATDTPIGTVVSTIDELDVYFAKQGEGEEDNPKAGQTRADHAKVKVSDTEGDKAVYGVVGSFNAQGKVNVASVGIGSVRVTGVCEKGDLLESNGDGTAKVQSDDIVRSKTIGKVTIGNSSTDVKLVSCVLYCG